MLSKSGNVVNAKLAVIKRGAENDERLFKVVSVILPEETSDGSDREVNRGSDIKERPDGHVANSGNETLVNRFAVVNENDVPIDTRAGRLMVVRRVPVDTVKASVIVIKTGRPRVVKGVSAGIANDPVNVARTGRSMLANIDNGAVSVILPEETKDGSDNDVNKGNEINERPVGHVAKRGNETLAKRFAVVTEKDVPIETRAGRLRLVKRVPAGTENAPVMVTRAGRLILANIGNGAVKTKPDVTKDAAENDERLARVDTVMVVVVVSKSNDNDVNKGNEIKERPDGHVVKRGNATLVKRFAVDTENDVPIDTSDGRLRVVKRVPAGTENAPVIVTRAGRLMLAKRGKGAVNKNLDVVKTGIETDVKRAAFVMDKICNDVIKGNVILVNEEIPLKAIPPGQSLKRGKSIVVRLLRVVNINELTAFKTGADIDVRDAIDAAPKDPPTSVKDGAEITVKAIPVGAKLL